MRAQVAAAVFVVACAAIVLVTVANHPANSAVGFLVLLAGVPACRYWQRANRVS